MNARSRSLKRSKFSVRETSGTKPNNGTFPDTLARDADIRELPEELTKEAIGTLLSEKHRLEAKSLETEVMFNEMMNVVSTRRKQKLQQQASSMADTVKESVKKFHLLLDEARSAFENYQASIEARRREEAAGQLFWKCRQMHSCMSSTLMAAAEAEKLQAQLLWTEKMTQVGDSMTNIFKLVDDTKKLLAKERELTKTLATMVKKSGGAHSPQLRAILDAEQVNLTSSSSSSTGDSPPTMRRCSTCLLMATLTAALACWVLFAVSRQLHLDPLEFTWLPGPSTGSMLGPSEPRGWLAATWQMMLDTTRRMF